MLTTTRATSAGSPGVAVGSAGRGIPFAIAGLTLVHLVLSRTHDTWAWSFTWLRDARGMTPWALVALVLVALLPATARSATRAASWMTTAPSGAARVTAAAAAGAALLVWALPDRTWFIGDSLLREGMLARGYSAADVTQTFPLERLLALRMPMWLAGPLGLPADPNLPHAMLRLGGACLAAGLVAALVHSGRELGLRGLALASFVAIGLSGGHLTLLTGMGKASGLLGLLVVLAMAQAYRALRTGAGLGRLGIVVTFALALHRAGWALLPLHAYVAWRCPRRRDGGPQPAWVSVALGIFLPAIVVALLAPSWWRIVVGYDLPNHFATRVTAVDGGVHLLLVRLADLVGVLVLYAPLLPLALVWGKGGGDPPWSRVSLLTLAGFAPLLLAHPRQGIVRDFDVFDPLGVTLAIVVAAALARRMTTDRGGATRFVPLIAYAGLAVLLPLLVSHDTTAGLERVRAFAVEAPARSVADRAAIWDFLALRGFRTREWEVAAEAAARSSELEPNPRMTLMAGIAAMAAGRPEDARRFYEATLARLPAEPVAWAGVAGSAGARGDSVSLGRALSRLRAFGAASADARIVRHTIAMYPQMADPVTRQRILAAVSEHP